MSVTNGYGKPIIVDDATYRYSGVHPSRIDPHNESRKQAIYGRKWRNCGCHVRSWILGGQELRCLECGGDCT